MHSPACLEDEGFERLALERMDPEGFQIRHPPAAHNLDSFITPDDKLFHTMHMGAAVVNRDKWVLVVDGLVKQPLTISLSQLRQFPTRSLTSFHECYGSPVKPPDTNVWRIGNVVWTGVSLKSILDVAAPLPEAAYVWSEGLDRGAFAGYHADRYQKDLPLSKALCPEVMLAWQINGQSLPKERGGPVRLVVPGWFGTNSTKWICKLSLQSHRAPSIFTTVLYNEVDPTDEAGRMRPVWHVEPNSLIVSPQPNQTLKAGSNTIEGWAWSFDAVARVEISTDGGTSWAVANLTPRLDFSWQKFKLDINLEAGEHDIIARAKSTAGLKQPMSGRRNHCSSITIIVN